MITPRQDGVLLPREYGTLGALMGTETRALLPFRRRGGCAAPTAGPGCTPPRRGEGRVASRRVVPACRLRPVAQRQQTPKPKPIWVEVSGRRKSVLFGGPSRTEKSNLATSLGMTLCLEHVSQPVEVRGTLSTFPRQTLDESVKIPGFDTSARSSQFQETDLARASSLTAWRSCRVSPCSPNCARATSKH